MQLNVAHSLPLFVCRSDCFIDVDTPTLTLSCKYSPFVTLVFKHSFNYVHMTLGTSERQTYTQQKQTSGNSRRFHTGVPTYRPKPHFDPSCI